MVKLLYNKDVRLPKHCHYMLTVIVPDDIDVVPYTIWDNHTKIVLRVQTEMRFYKGQPEAIPNKTVQTAWVNYIFEKESRMSHSAKSGDD
jgi:hypothetical protein